MLWVYRTTDSVFLRDRGTEDLKPDEAEVELDSVPDVVRERFEATAPNKRRLAIATEAASVTDVQRDSEIDNMKAFQALARATHELKTNAWTLAQFGARIKQIYRGL
jgi:hypothetical protein